MYAAQPVRADHDGLRLRPNLPRLFANAGIDRHFRGAVYRIRYRGHGSVVQAVRVDGQVASSDLLPLAAAGQTVAVDVDLG